MKRVEVVWIDITYKQAGWHHKNDVDDFIKDDNQHTLRQLGYLYRVTDRFTVLVDSYFLDENDYGTIHKIPTACVISVTELTVVPTIPF